MTSPGNCEFSYLPMTSVNPEVVPTTITESLYEEALAESQTTINQEAKKVIAQRINEINRTRTLLRVQEAALAKLLSKTPEEIALTVFI